MRDELVARATDQFVSTITEWHYLAGGFSLGFASGVYVTLRYLRGSNDP